MRADTGMLIGIHRLIFSLQGVRESAVMVSQLFIVLPKSASLNSLHDGFLSLSHSSASVSVSVRVSSCVSFALFRCVVGPFVCLLVLFGGLALSLCDVDFKQALSFSLSP